LGSGLVIFQRGHRIREMKGLFKVREKDALLVNIRGGGNAWGLNGGPWERGNQKKKELRRQTKDRKSGRPTHT